MDCNPNVEYLLRFYPIQYFHIWRTNDISTFLHEDGWLEVNLSLDSLAFAKRAKDKIDHYENHWLSVLKYSETRYQYLKETIRLLRNHGRVFVVRTPAFPGIYKLENVLMPDFDVRMERLCESEDIHYLNYGANGADYRYTDGNHLWKGSSKAFSIALGNRITVLSKPL